MTTTYEDFLRTIKLRAAQYLRHNNGMTARQAIGLAIQELEQIMRERTAQQCFRSALHQ
jgi:hypothetical protein